MDPHSAHDRHGVTGRCTSSRTNAVDEPRTPSMACSCTSNVSRKCGHVGAAHDGDEVVLAGAHQQRLHPGHVDDGVTHLPPTVLADLEEHEGAQAVAEHRRVERRREPGDRPDTAQTVDAGVGRRARDVAAAARSENDSRPSATSAHEERPIDVVDVSIEGRRVAARVRHFVQIWQPWTQSYGTSPIRCIIRPDWRQIWP